MQQVMECWDLRRERSDELLEEFYQKVYLPAFPLVSEREDPTVWKPRLWGDASRVELHGLIAGLHLKQPERRELAGGILFHYLPVSGTALIDYVVIVPAFRRRGLGGWLMHQAVQALAARPRREGRELAALFMEVDDPRRGAAAQDIMDPWGRVAFFQGLGARVVDIPYVQPELLPGQGKLPMLLFAMLLNCECPQGISAKAVVGFVHEEYRAYGVAAPESDAGCQAMLQAIRGPSIALYALRP